MNKPIIGLSSCLVGDNVRYNGGHKKDTWITSNLSTVADFKTFCPEVGIGLPIPRPTLRLIATSEGIKAVDSNTQTSDVTDDLINFYHQNANTIADLDGYILMQGSPSCGMERVKLYGASAMPEKNASGIYAEQLQLNHPNLPIEEAGRLNDSAIAESFLTRLFVYNEWRTTKPYLSASALINFHSRHKFLIMLHDYAGYRKTGKMLSDLSNDEELKSIADHYFTNVMQSLKAISNNGQRTNALLHLFGYVKNYLNSTEKESVLAVIKNYQQALVPYIAPLTVLRHYAMVHKQAENYLWQQSVWAPYPEHLNQYRNIV